MTNASLADDTLAFLVEGYRFTAGVWKRAASGALAAPLRLLGGPATLVRGEAGVELFYDRSRMKRHGAMPKFIGEPLFGHGSVHSLDGDEHLHRKATFVDAAYEDAQVERLAPHLEREWHAELLEWAEGGERSAYDAAVGAIGRAMMRWAGLPGTGDAKTRWSRRLAQIVDGFGSPWSPAYLAAWGNRLFSDAHAAELIDAVRAGTLAAEDGTALDLWARHRDESGELLPAKLAGIELQNTIRPAIAVSRFVAFAAKALHDHPDWRHRIAVETAEREHLVGGPLAVAFAQEVRRTAPFVPMLPALATRDSELDGQRIAAGERVLIDIQAENHDAATWERPDAFDPSRFVGREDYEAIRTFIPQGGGEVPTGHRCPGEKVAIAALSAAIAAMSDPRVRILDAGLDVDLRRFPTKPASGGEVRAVPGAGAEAERADATGRCPVAH